MNIEDALNTLQSSMKGLDESEATTRFEKYGPNELRKKKPISPLRIFVEQFKGFLIIILLAATVVLLPTFSWAYQAKDLVYAQTMVFTIMVMFEMFNAFNCRSERHSILKVGPFSNRWL